MRNVMLGIGIVAAAAGLLVAMIAAGVAAGDELAKTPPTKWRYRTPTGLGAPLAIIAAGLTGARRRLLLGGLLLLAAGFALVLASR